MKKELIEKQLKENLSLIVSQLSKNNDIIIKTSKDGIKLLKAETIK